MALHFEHSPHNHIPSADESSIPELEIDQTIAPRPEEEIADVLRAKPDVEDHSEHRVNRPRCRKRSCPDEIAFRR